MNLCCRPSDSFLDHNVGELVARGPWAVDTRGPCCTPTKLILCTSALLASSYGQLPPSRANRLQTRRLQPAELRRQWQWPIGTQTCWGSYPSASRGERPAPASGSSTRLLSVCLQAEQRGAHAVVFRDACGAAPSLPAPTRCQTMECCANSSGGRLTRLGLWRRAVRDWDRASFIMPEMLRCNPTKPQSAQHRARTRTQNTVDGIYPSSSILSAESHRTGALAKSPEPVLDPRCVWAAASTPYVVRTDARCACTVVIPSAVHPDDPGLLISLGAP